MDQVTVRLFANCSTKPTSSPSHNFGCDSRVKAGVRLPIIPRIIVTEQLSEAENGKCVFQDVCV